MEIITQNFIPQESKIEAGNPGQTTDFLPSGGASCYTSLNDPPTPHPSGAWDRTDFIRYSEKLEAALRQFMAVTETSDEGITQMATIEGRVKFYERLRAVREEAHGILSHNDKDLARRALDSE